MTPRAFRTAQRLLGYRTNSDFAQELNTSKSSVDGYRTGRDRIPGPVERLIEIMCEIKGVPKEKIWPTEETEDQS